MVKTSFNLLLTEYLHYPLSLLPQFNMNLETFRISTRLFRHSNIFMWWWSSWVCWRFKCLLSDSYLDNLRGNRDELIHKVKRWISSWRFQIWGTSSSLRIISCQFMSSIYIDRWKYCGVYNQCKTHQNYGTRVFL